MVLSEEGRKEGELKRYKKEERKGKVANK